MATINDFKLYEETLTRWINSCTKEEQLPICEDAVQNLVVARFSQTINPLDLQLTVDSMRKLMEDKQRQIKYYPSQTRREIDLQTSFD